MTENSIVQFFNTGVDLAILIVIVRATRSVTRLEFKVEMMWKLFSHNMGLANTKD